MIPKQCTRCHDWYTAQPDGICLTCKDRANCPICIIPQAVCPCPQWHTDDAPQQPQKALDWTTATWPDTSRPITDAPPAVQPVDQCRHVGLTYVGVNVWRCPECNYYCGPADGNTPLAACTPDDAPHREPETYEARRQRIAAGRNIITNCQKCQAALCVCHLMRPQRQDEPGKFDTRGAGIQRAVDGLSQREYRVGAARFMPEER